MRPALAHVKYPRLGPARRQLALTRAREVSGASTVDPVLTELIDKALAANGVARARASAWPGRAARNLYGSATVALVRELDRALGTLYDMVRGNQRTFDEGTTPRAWADALADEGFPDGAGGITSLEYIERVQCTFAVLRVMRGARAEAVRGLGLELMVSRLEALAQQCQEAISAPRVTYDEVRESEDVAADAWLRVVARVQGLAATGRPEDVALAEAVFHHLEAQRVEYAQYRARRRRMAASRRSE